MQANRLKIISIDRVTASSVKWTERIDHIDVAWIAKAIALKKRFHRKPERAEAKGKDKLADRLERRGDRAKLTWIAKETELTVKARSPG